MKIKYFKPEENYNEIIGKFIEPDNIKSINQIITGWTNIVFEAATKDDISYFFRFPRDDFWSKMMIKDCAFCEFINGKTSFRTPELKLCFNEGRPFSMHQKIEGTVLTERLSDLSDKGMENIAEDISRFIYELSNVDPKGLPKECNVTILDFLDELANTHFADIKYWQYDYFKDKHTEKNLVHGDLNPGNIIVDDENNVVAVLDFCFAGAGNPYADISRIIGRSPLTFKKIMMNKYEDYTNTKLDNNMLDRFVDVWTDIEIGYVDYIRKHNPDIKLPDAVS